jgi:beta-mannosidase
MRSAEWVLIAMATVCAASAQELWQPYSVAPRGGASHVDLAKDWQLGWLDRQVGDAGGVSAVSKWITVAEPTSVQMALHKAGELPHPYQNLNSSRYSWVDEKVWYYKKRFVAPAAPTARYAFLTFAGIDYFARIWLNGVLLGAHEGMFGGPVVEVAKLLKPGGENEILVEVRAGNWGRKATYDPRNPGHTIKPWVISGGTGGEMFFSVGMWQGARLDFVGAEHLERPFVVTKTATAAQATLRVSVELLRGAHSLEFKLHPAGNEQMRYYREYWKDLKNAKPLEVDFELLERGTGRSEFKTTIRTEALTGRNWVERDVVVPSPKLWWPNGMGKPHLYRARLTLRDGTAVRDRIEFDYGIRTLSVEMTPGPRQADRWSEWQFVVNGRKFFVKGVNWMPADMLLDVNSDRYHWLLSAARNAGIQMVRVWGGGILEPETFYEAANELGILVWQDFPMGNGINPDLPKEVWEAQVMQTIFRLWNHPALALYCGGNEFNPYAEGNAAAVGILERSLADFDPTRPFRRTSPDNGSMHDYPDMDPTWYARKFPFLPYMSETGMHNIPNAETLREVVDAAELAKPLSRMFEKDFAERFPDFRHHFVEYAPSRVPRMLSRASHIEDIAEPTLEALSEATQIGAGEFYQVLSELLQANYPVTAGLMPWVFKRPWPVVAIQMVDGLGHPTAPYYFLKRTYEPVHVLAKVEHLLLAPGESMPVNAAVTNSEAAGRAGLTVTARVLDDRFQEIWKRSAPIALKPGPSVAAAQMGSVELPKRGDCYLFLLMELRDASGALVSRSVYHPRVLNMLSDAKALDEFRRAPKEWPSLDKGPWLKPAVAANVTSLSLEMVEQKAVARGRTEIRVRVRNTGRQPAFPVKVDVTGAKRSFFASDNYFWLAPGESKMVTAEILWREPGHSTAAVAAGAWNAATISSALSR